MQSMLPWPVLSQSPHPLAADKFQHAAVLDTLDVHSRFTEQIVPNRLSPEVVGRSPGNIVKKPHVRFAALDTSCQNATPCLGCDKDHPTIGPAKSPGHLVLSVPSCRHKH